jgi:hypothetical protein
MNRYQCRAMSHAYHHPEFIGVIQLVEAEDEEAARSRFLAAVRRNHPEIAGRLTIVDVEAWDRTVRPPGIPR